MGLVPWVDRVQLQEQSPLPRSEAKPELELESESISKLAEPLESASESMSKIAATHTPLAQPDFMHVPLLAMPFRGQLCTQLGKSDSPLLILVEALSFLEPNVQSLALNDEPGAVVSQLCKTHRDVALVFKLRLPDTDNVDDLSIELNRPGLKAWQLPHPSLLRESPQRKRQAWNVLKTARAFLPSGNLVAQ